MQQQEVKSDTAEKASTHTLGPPAPTSANSDWHVGHMHLQSNYQPVCTLQNTQLARSCAADWALHSAFHNHNSVTKPAAPAAKRAEPELLAGLMIC
jgi:hypothetical protein